MRVLLLAAGLTSTSIALAQSCPDPVVPPTAAEREEVIALVREKLPAPRDHVETRFCEGNVVLPDDTPLLAAGVAFEPYDVRDGQFLIDLGRCVKFPASAWTCSVTTETHVLDGNSTSSVRLLGLVGSNVARTIVAATRDSPCVRPVMAEGTSYFDRAEISAWEPDGEFLIGTPGCKQQVTISASGEVSLGPIFGLPRESR